MRLVQLLPSFAAKALEKRAPQNKKLASKKKKDARKKHIRLLQTACAAASNASLLRRDTACRKE
jgi:hypothetical protein